MFSKIALVSLALLVSGVMSSPIGQSSALAARGGPVSFDHWGGFDSLDNFDNFYGVDNFAHFDFEQVVVQETSVVCHAQAIEIIQQRLVVLQEMAKRIITEQICEVETQTVVFEQFHASLGSFSHDLRRDSGHQVGYDSSITGHYGDLFGDDGSLSVHDLGFSGSDVGQNTVVVGGGNWNDATSPASVDNAFFTAKGAHPGL
ncbi:hypothetical protein BDZ89DRAFT_1075151 [Hymenopellis radicata]|nr:hypothetical protein BDZ89DRAFT_1075151 [Hymenopellis radicata]